MQENIWTNTRTHVVYGPNNVLGSPRGWLQRAVDVKQADLGLHATSLDPRRLSVAGIWTRLQPLPDTGTWPALYRYFRLIENPRRISRAKESEFFPVIGMAVAVPHDQVWTVYRHFQQTAIWTWWSWPRDSTQRPAPRNQRELDHADLYQRFDQGHSVKKVAQDLNLLSNSVAYVYKKWQDGQPPVRKPRKQVDHAAVAEDLRMGRSVADIVREYDISRTMVYKIGQRFRVK